VIIEPLYDKLIVRRHEAADVTPGGIVLPETREETEKLNEGVVFAAGGGYRVEGALELQPLRVKEGDQILFGQFAGSEVQLDGVKFLVMREDEVMGILRPDSEPPPA
jgi:chaperonin GroES